MSLINEGAGQQSQLQAALDQGLASLSRNQTITFTMYQKTTLALDGSVFWVATGNTQIVNGSLHYGVDKRQNEDETIAINRVTFTSEYQIQLFDAESPSTLFIGTFDGLQFSFSRQGDFYQQSNLWHYVGDAVYPALSSQLVASSAALAALAPIVSNSLPIWLSQNTFAPVYPSYLVPDNITPPYIVAHIDPDETEAVASFPTIWNGYSSSSGIGYFAIGVSAIGTISQTFGSSQLMKDKVRLTLYGFNNQLALQYLVSLMDYSLNYGTFGFMNSPSIKDDKRTQVEMSMIAQKKHIDIIASYYQSTADAIARNLIVSAPVTYTTSAA